MGFDLRQRFLFDILWRVLLLAILLVTALHLLLETQYYATALVIFLSSALLAADLLAVIARTERTTARFLEALASGSLEGPARGATPELLRTAYDRALGRLLHDRRRQQQDGDYLQTLLDTVPAGLLVLQADGTATIVNRAAHRLLGESVPRLAELPALGTAAAEQLKALVPGTHRIVQLTNGLRLLASAAQFATPNGKPQRLISLQRLAGDLDAVELKAWDDMASVLAHEMMNSLTPIASLSESLDTMLRAGGNPEEIAATLETITRRSHGLMRFVERYRQVAELPEPQPRPLPLREMMENVERLMRPTFDERRIALEIRLASPDITALADADLLEQALINLLRNAGDALTDEPQPRIVIDCNLKGDHCVLDVRDNGPGITAAQREQIFVPFFTTKLGGSGIGLSLARRIVQSHGGNIIVLPNEPRGSIFRVVLPAQR